MIEELLKDEEVYDVRVTCGDRWLVWDNFDEAWIVLQHKRYARNTSVLYRGAFLVAAIEALKGEE